MTRRLVFWLLAFVFAYGIWIVHDDSATLPELLAGVLVSAIAATGTELVRQQRVADLALRWRFLRYACRLIPNSIRDCAALTRAAFAQLLDPQPTRGVTVAQPFRAQDDEAAQNGRRALALGLGSFAPATIVIGVDPDREMVIAHQLPGPSKPTAVDPLELG